jgi:hypothetical protein
MHQTAYRRSMILAAGVAACSFATLSMPASAALPKAAVTEGYDDIAPFSQRLDMTCSGNYAASTFTVPASMRLVIDYVSASVETLPIGSALLFDVATINNNAEVEAHLPMQLQGTIFGQSNYALSAPMKVFADPLSTVTIAILTSGTSCGGTIGIYGHYVPTP